MREILIYADLARWLKYRQLRVLDPVKAAEITKKAQKVLYAEIDRAKVKGLDKACGSALKEDGDVA